MTDAVVQEIPDTNRTTLEFYVDAQQAYDMWKADPTNVHILDVRTFEEYLFVGHFEFAKNVPLVFPRFDPEGPSMPGRPPGCSGVANPGFLPAVQQVFSPTDTILVMCSTGGRAAMAVNSLAQAGYAKVYNIVHGFEGDRVEDPGSVFVGKHMRNGWKNAGLPWGYDFHPDLMWVQHQP
jgi:rhodanese-related sulfurtransferase